MLKIVDHNGFEYYTANRPEINCFEVYGENYKSFLNDFIPYLEATEEESWIDVVFANADTSKRCVIWHLIGFTGCDYPENKFGSNNLDWYDANVCFIQRAGCEVNDGNHPDYSQPTPKQRSIAYLKNLLSGKELTPMQLLDEFMMTYHSEKALH